MTRRSGLRVTLACKTPEAWYAHAETRLHTLLIDHANCEKKAAGTALSLLYRYVDKPKLLRRMSRIAREELRHYEQVLQVMDDLRLSYGALSPGRYAGVLRGGIRNDEPGRLIDTLLVGAVVEARSCERFVGLAERFPPLRRFYAKLVEAEARHADVYLELAESAQTEALETVSQLMPLHERLNEFVGRDRDLVLAPDGEFRFHSGVPEESTAS